MQSGIIVYSTLARARLQRLRRRRRAPPRSCRRCGAEGCARAALYADAWTNDGRLTIANVRGAAERGAVVLNYAEVVSIGTGGAEVLVDGRTIPVQRAVDRQRDGAVGRPRAPARGSGARPSMRLSKGVHVLVDGGAGLEAALTIAHDQVRVSFAVPWEGMLLLGTTDTEHDGEPEDVAVTDEDIRQVLDEAQVAVEGLGPARATLLRPARAARGRGPDRERAARDGVHARARRAWSASPAAS